MRSTTWFGRTWNLCLLIRISFVDEAALVASWRVEVSRVTALSRSSVFSRGS